MSPNHGTGLSPWPGTGLGAEKEIHRDPADRVIIATARLERLTLVTTDGKIRGYPHVTTLA
jgi:PIN domain nuclease of toxin-antitoxin system